MSPLVCKIVKRGVTVKRPLDLACAMRGGGDVTDDATSIDRVGQLGIRRVKMTRTQRGLRVAIITRLNRFCQLFQFYF